MQKITEIESLQLHYYLSDKSHSMDAKILNKVEAQLLRITEEVSKMLDIDIIVEAHALEEGGIKAIYQFFTKQENRKTVIAISSFFAGIIATIMADVIADQIKTDPEMERLKKQKIELEIKKLKNDIANDSIEKSKGNVAEMSLTQNEDLIEDIAIYLGENNKIKISKSKFYEYLLKEGKIEKVSTQVLNTNLQPIEKEKFVPRKDFKLFIINETEIEPDYAENITLEIVSPVLNRNRSSWKAIYKDETINLKLKDEDFKELIITKALSFSNGTKIVCDVETKMKMNSEGDIFETGRTIYNVSQIIYPDGTKIDVLK